MTLQLPLMTPCWCSIMKAAALLPDPSAPCTPPQAVKTRSTTISLTGAHASASWLTSLVEEMIRTWASATHPHSTCVPGLVLCVGSFTRLMWVDGWKVCLKKKKRLAAPWWPLKPLETNGPIKACHQLEFGLIDIMSRVVALCPRTWPVWGCSGCQEVRWKRAAAALLQTLIYSWSTQYSSAGLNCAFLYIVLIVFILYYVHCFEACACGCVWHHCLSTCGSVCILCPLRHTGQTKRPLPSCQQRCGFAPQRWAAEEGKAALVFSSNVSLIRRASKTH